MPDQASDASSRKVDNLRIYEPCQFKYSNKLKLPGNSCWVFQHDVCMEWVGVSLTSAGLFQCSVQHDVVVSQQLMIAQAENTFRCDEPRSVINLKPISKPL